MLVCARWLGVAWASSEKEKEKNLEEPLGLEVRSHTVGTTAVVYAGDYLNKLTGERIERECKQQLDSGCRALVIDFSDTAIVNSIAVSILLGIIDIAEKRDARVVFSDVNDQAVQLFEMLGVIKHVAIARDEQEALDLFTPPTQTQAIAH